VPLPLKTYALLAQPLFAQAPMAMVTVVPSALGVIATLAPKPLFAAPSVAVSRARWLYVPALPAKTYASP